MMTGIDRRRLLGAGSLLLFGTVGVPAADDVSRWDGDARSAARLIAGSQPKGADALRAGIEIRLKAGWHTYWRYPGDAGVPPQFDFGESQNVKSVEVLWPAPQRLVEGGGVSVGYPSDVIIPLRVVPKDGAKPVALRLKLDYAICEKLCVPAEAKAELALTKEAKGVSSQDAALAAARRACRKACLGTGGPLVIRSVRREAGAVRPRIVVDLVLSADAPVDLFAEGPTTQWALPLPAPVDGAPPGVKRFAFDIDGVPPGASDRGALVTLTAVTPGQAIEVAIRLD